MCRAGTPIDIWGVGTELGTSRDSPVVNGVYKLVAELSDGTWRGVAKLSEGKTTLPGTKQVFRRFDDGAMAGDVVGTAEEELDGEPLLVPVMREGEIVHEETLERDAGADQKQPRLAAGGPPQPGREARLPGARLRCAHRGGALARRAAKLAPG